MSISVVSSPSRLSERLTPARIKELCSLILKSEHPHTSRKIVEPLLVLLVGGPFDLKKNYLIKEPNVILLLLELLPSLREPLQLEIWSSLGVILHRSLWNIHSCCHLQLIEQCLQYLSHSQSAKVSSHVTRVIEILAGYSLSVKELRVLLSYLYTGHMKTWAPHSIAVIGTLNNISAEVQPDVFFNFSGAAGATMTLPPLSKWPTTSGFTFTTWLQIEKPYDSQREYYKPVVYWFRTGKQLGYSAHLIGSTLILETIGKGHKKPQTNAVDFVFQSYQWYMLTVVYVHNRIRSSQLGCYVDGKPVMTSEVTLPNTDDVYDKCFIGSSPVATEETVFQGQMSAIYLFRDTLSPDTIAALYKLGPSYKSQFKFDAESDVPLTKQQKKVLFDGHLSNMLVFSYNAKAVDGQLCLEASPVDNQPFFVHSPHATLLEGVDPVITTSFHSALHSLGGMQALFPLLSQLDLPQAEPHGKVDYSLSVKVLSLMFELARNSTSFMLQLVQMKAMELISYLLEKVSCQHLVTELVSCIFDFAKYLMVAPNGINLLCQVIEHLLFSASLWIRASEKVQIYLYSLLATEFSARPLGKTGVNLRELIGVPLLLFILREHYSLVASENLVCYVTLTEVRPYLLLIVKEFVTKDRGIQQEEMESILDYLCTVPQEENLHDVLKLLLALVFEDKHGTVVKMFQNCDGLNVATKLLACNSEELTLHALQLIGKVLHHLSSKQQQLLIESVGLLAVVREKLLSAGQPVSIAMFNTLFEVLVDCPSRRIIEGHYLALDLSHRIKFPRMLAVMIELLCSLHTQVTDWEESDALMRMQLFSYISSLCVQNRANCRAILRLPNWEHWLLMLADQQGAVQSDYSNLQDMVYRLFHTLLLYSFQEEQDGWRVWVETAATMHAYTASKASEVAATTPQMESLTTFTEFHSGSASSSVEHIRDEITASPILHDDPTAKSFTEPLLESTDTVSTKEEMAVEAESGRPSTEDSLESVKNNLLMDEKPKQGTVSPLATTSVKRGQSKPLKPPSLAIDSPSFSRTSSTETPQSPFFIPRNPFLSLVGKIPKFQWSLAHIELLENLLKSLKTIVERWKSGSPSKSKLFLAENIGDESNKYLRSNIAHLLALISDNVIGLNGGLKQLLARSSNPKLAAKQKLKPSESVMSTQSQSLRAAMTSDPSLAESLLTLTLELVDVIVLSGLLKLDTIEARMHMEAGGATKQGLRVVLAATSLSCMQTNKEYMNFHEHYYHEKQAAAELHQDSVQLLLSLGVGACSLETYFETSYQKKLEDLRGFQCLLTNEYITMMKKTIPRDGDSKQLLQQLVLGLVYYLSAMCVSKYRNILEATDSEDTSVRERTDTLASESATSIPSGTSASDIDTSVKADFDATVEMPSPKFSVEQSLVPTSFPLFSHALDISEQIEAAMQIAGPFLCELLVEHRTILSKVLVGADGRLLLTDAVMKFAENRSVVEMTMLLCSQEWQSSLQKMGGKTFTEILTDGKHVARFSERYLKSVASKATTDFEQLVNAETEKFTNFEEQLSLYLSQTIRSANENCQLRRADVIRHSASAKELWRKISYVVDETGAFDSTPLRRMVYKKLDLREDTLRQRLQLISNPSGSCHERAVRSVEVDSGEVPLKEGDLALAIPKPHFTAALSRSESISVGSDELAESLALELIPDQDSSSRLLSLPCQMLVLAHSIPGTLVFTSSSLAFTADDSSEDYSKASYLTDYCPINGKWMLQDVSAVFSRRYLQRRKALELFFANRTSAFFVFGSSKEVKTVVRRLPKVGVGTEYNLPPTRAMSLAPPQLLLKKSSMTAKWERREISNFEYLMYLNTIAGRTYNDLNQYPVFPWLLKDYTSEHLDLANPDIYRDLSKPIGALNASRLNQFEERYNSLEDDDIPAFYFGTHYSTMAFVLHWLVRVEPFASLHINFHDGSFDHGSRMFASLQESWRNSSEDTSDVNELTPEFFYLPEILLNENKFNLGHEGPCDEGGLIDDVRLPPWAKSAHDFIRIHREALESEHVSSTLHRWIDLIFGYKQRGEEAVKAKNVFYYLTYTGAVDLESIEDPKLRRGLEEQIRHFGQTPVQLLTEPHPQRQSLVKGFPPQSHHGLNPRDPALVAELQITPDVPVALVQLSQGLAAPGPNMLIVSCNQLYALNKWSVHPGTSTHPPSVTLEADPNIASGLKTRLGDPLDQRVSAANSCFASTPICDVIFVCGYWDNSFKCFDAMSGSMIQSVFGHRDVVTCLHFAPEGSLHSSAGDGLIGTGSHDTTVLLWRWSDKAKRVIGSLSETQVDSLTPLTVLTGHEQSVACVAVSCSLGLVVSGAKRGPCLVHDTSGELLYKLTPSLSWVHPHLISITRDGHFVIHYTDQKGYLVVFTCNGRQLCHYALRDPALALVVTKDGRYVVAGGFDYRVRVFMAHNLKLKYAHEPFDSSIRSLHITGNQRFILVGLASGSVAALTTHFWL